MIDAAITSPGGIRVGATFRWVAQIVGQKMETKGAVTAYDPPRAYARKSTSGPFPVSGGLTCEAVAGGTRVTQTVDAEPGGFFKLAEGLLMKQVQGQWDKSLKKLKQVLKA
ncbi:MAG: SRPBCC family protein [Chloroflexi bacterium]|nr:SRPBCC family protein [Chloroflexota bacterium]